MTHSSPENAETLEQKAINHARLWGAGGMPGAVRMLTAFGEEVQRGISAQETRKPKARDFSTVEIDSDFYFTWPNHAQCVPSRNETLRGLADFFSESEHLVWSNDEIADCLRNMMDAAPAFTSPESISPPYDPSRCEICDWPLAESREKGCVPGDCSYRPDTPAEQERIRKRRAALALSRPERGPLTEEGYW